MSINDVPIEAWRYAWRKGVSQVISTKGLEALREALHADSPELIQGSTTTPPPLLCVFSWPVEGACPIGYAAWKGDDLTTVGETEDAFAALAHECDKQLGQPGGIAAFLNAWDDFPREEIVKELLTEVELTLAQRENNPAGEVA